jgi:electron transport complex protein RnfC
VNDAVRKGIPLIERIATISGAAIAEPKNLRIKIGQPLSKLVDFCGGIKGELGKVIQGGPMMGMAAVSLDVPATRGTSGVLLFNEGQVLKEPEGPCVRCGNCVRACPAFILPTEIANFARKGMFDEAEKLNAMDCIECGCCTYICPARIFLVQALRQAKGAILAKRRKV